MNLSRANPADVLPTTAPTVVPAVPPDAGVPLWFFWLTVAVALAAAGAAWAAGWLRPARVGIRRVPAGRPAVPLVGVMFAAVVVWLVVPSLLLQPPSAASPPPAVASQPASAPAAPPSALPPEVSPLKLVAINATVPVLALLVLLTGDALVRPRVGQRLGFEPRRAPRGLLAGLGAMALALPAVCAVMFLTEIVYEKVGFEHPKAHELLEVMAEAGSLLKYLAIAAAVLVAPLWEEALFRGHLQTLILEGIARLRGGFAPAVAPAPVVADVPADSARPLDAWVAIVLASTLFALVHQPWTWPPIFVLSVCFGLAYERTGNLWVPVAMHATFNGVMTAIYLTGIFAN